MARPRTGSLVWAKSGWRARVTLEVDGERVQRTINLATMSKAVAKAKLAKVLAEDAPPAAVDSVSDYADGWFTGREARGIRVKDERGWWDHYWAPALGTLRMRDVRPGHVRAVLEQMAEGELRGPRNRRLRRTSILRARAVVLAMFGDAWQDELVAENPVARAAVPRLREARKDRAVLTDDELRRLLAHPEVHPEIKMLVLLSRTIGGMREGDLHALSWESFGPDFATCRVPRAKTDKPQELDVPATVRPFIVAWWLASERPVAGPVFPVRRGKRAGERKGKNGYAARLRAALLVAGVDRHELHHETETTLPVDFHSTRRAYATALARANVATSIAQVLTGHSDPRVHQRYVAAATIRALPEAAVPLLPGGFCAKSAETPKGGRRDKRKRPAVTRAKGVDLRGLEPRTSALRMQRDAIAMVSSGGNDSDASSADTDGHPGFLRQRRNSAQKPPTAGDWMRPPAKPLGELARQVERDVAQRSRLCRRHAAELAAGVLTALGDVEGEGGQRDVEVAGDAAGPGVASAPRHWLPVAAEVAVALVELPEMGRSLATAGGVT